MSAMRILCRLMIAAFGCMLLALPAIAAEAEPFSLLGVSASKNGATLSVPMQIVIMLTMMTLLPAAVSRLPLSCAL